MKETLPLEELSVAVPETVWRLKVGGGWKQQAELPIQDLLEELENLKKLKLMGPAEEEFVADALLF